MTRRWIFLSACAGLLGGCADLPGTSVDPDPAPDDDDDAAATERPDPDTHGTLTGRVSAGGPVAGAVVAVGRLRATTDAAGWFRLADVPVGIVEVEASAEGYTGGRGTARVRPGEWAAVHLTMVSVSHDELPDPESGGVVFSGDGVEVEFEPGGTFTTADGEPVDGPVDVAIALVNTPEAMGAAPGMLAVGPGGVDVALESFGMAEVVLTAGGAPVTFSGVATLTIPLSASGLATFVDGAAIGLWSFDESLQRWVDEGQGVVSSGAFTAQVTHFTWWNADLPITESSCIEGTLHVAPGVPAAGYSVASVGVDYLGTAAAVTDGSGAFCVPVKRGATARLTAAGGSPQGGAWVWTQVVAADDVPSACGGVCTQIGAATVQSVYFDGDLDGWTPAAGDCDDGDPAIHPGAADPVGDGIDQNCDGPDGIDADGDGALAPSSGGADCDDSDPAVLPGGTEICDGVDQDCDGVVDEDAVGAPRHYTDSDGDGFGDPASFIDACAAPLGTVLDATDCDDSAASVAPDALEACNGQDDDCDGAVDEAGASGETPWYADADGDGFGDPNDALLACVGGARIADDTDCDDGLAAVHPGAAEVCNGLDDDCDGVVDPASAGGASVYFGDGDGDGYAAPGAATTSACVAPAGFTALLGDCDDTDPLFHPGAPETCADSADYNCDGSVLFADLDGDGAAACLDCDDADPTAFPGALEACDAVDTDCDGDLVDFFADTDGDGQPDCIDPDDDGDGVVDAADCAPTDPTVYLGAPEFCDGVDSDCDGDLVDGDADLDLDGTPDCVDPDDDGDGVADAADCGPTNPLVYPGAPELCDGIDNDCDAVVDSCALVAADAEIYGDGFGHELGSAMGLGDLNGDGTADIVVASPAANTAAPWGGAVHVFSGPQTGVLALGTATATLTGEAAEDWAGWSLATGCDFDDDGNDDLAVGAWGHDTAGAAAGRVYVLDGPITGARSLSTADAILDGESPGDWAGWSVACAGDVNGDGRDDLLVGAHRDDTTSIDAGAAYLVHGPISGAMSLAVADAKLVGVAHHDYAGYAVAGAGDVDGDGFDDLLIGAEGADGGGASSGEAYLVYGPVVGTVSLASADVTFVGASPGDAVGSVLAGVGDVSGDGVDDVAFGAEAAGGAGAAYVVFGGTGAAARAGVIPATAADVTIPGAAAGDLLGAWIAAAGDPDGDGVADLLVGAPGSDAGEPGGGAAYLLAGPLIGPVVTVTAPLATYLGGFPGDEAGLCVVGGGDTDGDGLDDVLIGAPGNDSTQPNAGAAYLQSGGGLP